MLKKILYGFIFIVSISGLACQTVSAPNDNTKAKNGAPAVNQKDLPPGISTNTIQPSGNATPGIPANPQELPKGTTPTPGIPANPGKQLPKGATPTPGIPSPEELKKQANQKVDINTVNNPSPTASNSGGDMRPRKATDRHLGGKVGNSQP